MQIQNINTNTNTNFKNNRLRYQKLESIMRIGNNSFPRISPYRVHMQHGNNSYPQRFFNWMERIGSTVDENRQKISSNDYIKVIKNDLENVRSSKLGDCGESCAITLASLIANGIRNFKIGLLLFDIDIRETGKKDVIARRSYNTTHEMVVVNSDSDLLNKDSDTKNVVIMDSWVGFCSGFQKAVDKFHETFMNGTRKYQDSRGYEYTYTPRIQLFDLNINATDELSKDFAENYPELVKNKQ